MIRLAVNAVALLSPFAGVAGYIRHLMTALAAMGGVKPRYFYGLGWSDELLAAPPAAVTKGKGLAQRWVPFAWEASRLVQTAAFALEGRPGHFDLYHEPTYLLLGERLPAVVTVHDLSFVHFPETHPAGRVRVLDKRLPRSLAAARAVITDSFAVRDEITAHYGVRAEKVHAIPLGVSPRFRPRAAHELPLLRRFELKPGAYLLCVGTLEPRKNLVRTVRAYATLPDALRSRFTLVVVGAVGWHESSIVAELEPLARRGEARFLSYVDEESLTQLYAGARAVLYPSLYEGFGLPIAEAMASGAPILTSNVGCLKELAEGAAVLVDPMDVAAIANALRRLLEDDSEAARLRAAGLERSRHLTWRRCAERTLEVYRQVLGA